MAERIRVSDFTDAQIALIFSKIDRSGGPGACWIWSGSRDRLGRARRKMPIDGRKRNVTIAKIVYCWSKNIDDYPEGMQINHTCARKDCCNPHHMKLGKRRDSLDWIARGRGGVCKRGHELGPETVLENATGRRCIICVRRYDRLYKRKMRAKKRKARENG